uniref:hypothetical protein n=1 Tax=Enterococcus faecium TaxID=1352 RepID=UPI0030C80AAB
DIGCPPGKCSRKKTCLHVLCKINSIFMQENIYFTKVSADSDLAAPEKQEGGRQNFDEIICT